MFVIMMLDPGQNDEARRPGLKQWILPVILAGIILASIGTIATGYAAAFHNSGALTIRDFAQTLFNKYGVAVELISMQLLFAVVGALYLGRKAKS
jgi:NADH-quinone oxidoreductase subunit J